jgi:putative transposase
MINYGEENKKQENTIMPDPRATPLHVSQQQQEVLQHLVRRATSAQRLVRRGKIILSAIAGVTNTKITQQLHMDSDTVRLWRERWRAAQSRLQAIEETGKPKLLKQAIERILTDEHRRGTPATFTLEQFMQITALACETPEAADRPVSHWTPRELADEAVKRGIVTKISPRTVERFLKGERSAAASEAVLAHPTSRRSR